MAFKEPPDGLRPWRFEINVEYYFILSSLAKHFQHSVGGIGLY